MMHAGEGRGRSSMLHAGEGRGRSSMLHAGEGRGRSRLQLNGLHAGRGCRAVAQLGRLCFAMWRGRGLCLIFFPVLLLWVPRIFVFVRPECQVVMCVCVTYVVHLLLPLLLL